MNLENIKNDLKKINNKKGLKINFLDEIKNSFKFNNQTKYTSVDYSIDFLNYQKSYHEMNCKKIHNLSYVIIKNNTEVAFAPLYLIIDKKNKKKITSNFKYIVKPILFGEMNHKDERNLIEFFFENLEFLKKKIGIKKLVFSSDVLNNIHLSYWDKFLLLKNFSNRLLFEQVIDLKINDREIWTLIRKSYKGLINKFKDNYQVHVLQNKNFHLWKEFQKFHLLTSKRKTRNQETWDRQLISMENKSAYFFYIQDENNKLIAGSLFDCTKDEAYYSVGVYNRKYKNLPLAHLILFNSINFFKKKKLKYINLGEIKFKKKIEKKILNIQNFKSGFATNTVLKIIYY